MIRKTIHVFLFFLFMTAALCAQRKVIVDADTGNEVDDIFALARILLEPDIEVTALNAAHWQTSHWSVASSMENSHRLNQQLLGEMNLAVKTFRGAVARMYDWGDRAKHSAASYEIIRQANALGPDEKLSILVLGALTNVSSAIFIDPPIAAKLKIYWLGSTMDFSTGVLKRNDFNCLMDPYALDYLLDSKAELNILPLNVAGAMQIKRSIISKEMEGTHLGPFLMDRWYHHIDGGRTERTLWDLALIAIFIDSGLAKVQRIKTSKDSGNREILFYTSIDAAAIYADFYTTIKKFKKVD